MFFFNKDKTITKGNMMCVLVLADKGWSFADNDIEILTIFIVQTPEQNEWNKIAAVVLIYVVHKCFLI